MSQLNITQLLGTKIQQIVEGDVQNPQKGTYTNPWCSSGILQPHVKTLEGKSINYPIRKSQHFFPNPVLNHMNPYVEPEFLMFLIYHQIVGKHLWNTMNHINYHQSWILTIYLPSSILFNHRLKFTNHFIIHYLIFNRLINNQILTYH